MKETLEILGQLFLAIILGGLIGLERKIAKKPAGLRTYSLVSLGSALFCLISQLAFSQGSSSYDPSRMASQIIVGIGFLGAGVILFHKSKIRGITTAASLWVTAGIGMAVGFKLYSLALLVTLLVLIILFIFWFIEDRLVRKYSLREEIDESE